MLAAKETYNHIHYPPSSTLVSMPPCHSCSCSRLLDAVIAPGQCWNKLSLLAHEECLYTRRESAHALGTHSLAQRGFAGKCRDPSPGCCLGASACWNGECPITDASYVPWQALTTKA